jgi:outer membrane protein assembly factor BamE (lipoprotein component of BamABCDE complex)
MRGHVAGVVARALLVGCSATGAKVTEDQLLQFQKGSTTLDQVVAKLGRPTTTMLMPNGERMIMYTYAQVQVRPATYIPIVGVFAGGADSKSNSATLIFDTAGILKSYSASSSAFGSGLGGASGTQLEQTPQQPRQEPPK